MKNRTCLLSYRRNTTGFDAISFRFWWIRFNGLQADARGRNVTLGAIAGHSFNGDIETEMETRNELTGHQVGVNHGNLPPAAHRVKGRHHEYPTGRHSRVLALCLAGHPRSTPVAIGTS